MTAPSFDSFVGVDWSGARGKAYSGLAVARCETGDGAPSLVAPPGARWRRTDFVDWVVSVAAEGGRMLIGIDCAFALPAPFGHALLGPDYTAAALWARIDAQCADDLDFFGGDFADHAAHAPHFWRGGKRPPGFAEHHRATELCCRDAGLGRPESPLKLVGAKQVGKGGLAGMRVLVRLQRILGEALAVWPFGPTDRARIVCVELYPRLFMRMAGHGSKKIRTAAELDRCLAALGSRPGAMEAAALSDHESDALVSAAGLRLIAGDAGVWSPPGLDDLARRAEGWIFGVA